MKRFLIIALLVCALFAVLCVAAYADEPATAGIYAENVLPDTVKVCTADSSDYIVAADATIGGNNVKFYSGAARLIVKIPTEASYTLILMQDSTDTTNQTIRYIDQQAKENGYVTFLVYPDKMENGKTYYIYAVEANSNGKGDPIATFQYYLPYMRGDVDGSRTMGMNDAILIMRYLVGLEEFNATQKAAADVDGSGTVGMNDAVMIMRYLVGLETSL